MDSHELAGALQLLALAPFLIPAGEARHNLQALAAGGDSGLLLPDADHPGLSVQFRVLSVTDSGLHLQAGADPQRMAATNWRNAIAAVPMSRDVLRFRALTLHPVTTTPPAPAGQTSLACAFPDQVWRVPRRALFRVAPTDDVLRLHTFHPDGSGPWSGRVLDLGIGGLAFEAASPAAPCAPGATLPACYLHGGSYRSPFFDLRVRHLQPSCAEGHWRIGAELAGPTLEVISSIQLATYRLESAQRQQRLAAEAASPRVRVNARRPLGDRQ